MDIPECIGLNNSTVFSKGTTFSVGQSEAFFLLQWALPARACAVRMGAGAVHVIHDGGLA